MNLSQRKLKHLNYDKKIINCFSLFKKRTHTRIRLIVFLAYEYHDPQGAQKWWVH